MRFFSKVEKEQGWPLPHPVLASAQTLGGTPGDNWPGGSGRD
jgi:hypothetical protein